ncbi:MAG: efflux RND transporter periplasmic adaptor subunit [Deltaproteobacteria bacterium]|nr:efflux RND transporter periplasmic adaptor subunit [Deltaproteobacteria bacterium]
MRHKIVLFIILFLVGLVGWQVYARLAASGKSENRQRHSVPVAVEVSSVQKKTLRDLGLFTGSLEAMSKFVVAPKVAGRLERLYVKIGDPVKKGALIAVLESDEYRQQVDQAKAELEVAKANFAETRSSLEVASREFKRAEALRQKKIASESELDAAGAQLSAQEAKHRVAAAQVAQEEAALRAAQIRLSYTKIHASWEDGDDARVVGERFVDEGTMLAPNTPIVSILGIKTLTGVIHVIERDYPKVHIGQGASVATDAYPGKGFSGRVVRIAPLIKEVSRSARVEIEIPNSEQLLKPGMFIRVQIEFSRIEEATVVPLTAVVKRNGEQGVFHVNMEEMKARFVPVKFGLMDNTFVQVLEPPMTGEVVTLGHHFLEEDAPVILPGESQTQERPEKESRQAGSTGRKP